jgi:hypothetical protein
MNISVPSRCPECSAGLPLWRREAVRPHRWMHRIGDTAIFCENYDPEGRHVAEPYGFIEFAWRPTKCRNGRWRWLRSVEHHDDGTFSLCDRAY